jgi:hypothetical protein
MAIYGVQGLIEDKTQKLHYGCLSTAGVFEKKN